MIGEFGFKLFIFIPLKLNLHIFRIINKNSISKAWQYILFVFYHIFCNLIIHEIEFAEQEVSFFQNPLFPGIFLIFLLFPPLILFFQGRSIFYFIYLFLQIITVIFHNLFILFLFIREGVIDVWKLRFSHLYKLYFLSKKFFTRI